MIHTPPSTMHSMKNPNPKTKTVPVFSRRFARSCLPFVYICLVLIPSSSSQQGVDVPRYNVTVPEDVPIGHLVGVAAGPGFGPPYSRWMTAQTNNRTLSSFHVDLSNGRITTKALLDREEKDNHTIILSTNSQLVILVFIQVLDINDETPTFQYEDVTESISESAPPKTVITLGSVRDNDLGKNSTQSVRIVSGNDDNAFLLKIKNSSSIDKILGLVVNTHHQFDYETVKEYHLIIRATDGGGRSSTMEVTVNIQDQNDNEPIFNTSTYSARIAENVTVGTHVITAEATDTDSDENGRITYSIDHRTDPEKYFSINPVTGEVRVNKPLDYETQKHFVLNLEAKDNGNPRQSGTAALDIIIENINEQPANIFLDFLLDYKNGHVPENIRVGTRIAEIRVEDPDVEVKPDTDIKLYGDEGHFELRLVKSKLGLFVKAGLDREVIAVYDMTVDVTDMGTPPLRANRPFKVFVDDVNDHEPVFEQARYDVEIEETAEVGMEVIKVSATDGDTGANRRLTYHIQDNPTHLAWFAVDSITGVITTKATVDCELDPRPVLVLIASDGGDPPKRGTVEVAISIRDVNDKQPEFDTSFYSIKISEKRRVGDCILTVTASDPECGASSPVTYKMARMLAPLTEFVVKSKSGDICIGSSLDYERTASYQFQVEAVDSDGLSAQAVVQVEITDENDNHPRFEPRTYPINLTSRTQRGALIFVQARDLDSGLYGTITYSITSGNDKGYFSINSVTGAVSLDKDLPDVEYLYILRIRATDGGGLTSKEAGEVKVSLIRGDIHPPIFSPTMFNFTILEDVDVGTLVGRVQASISDPEGTTRIEYTSLFQTQPWFEVAPDSGEIRTKAKLDREQLPFVVISVQAEAHFPPIYAAAQVNITILDVNDNPPFFPASTMLELEVREDEKVGSAIYLARAYDQDMGNNGTVTYRLHNVPGNLFAIDNVSGEITLKKELNYERHKQFDLLVIAKDLGTPTSYTANMTLTVNIKDVNDNPPIFDRDVYKFHVSEYVEIGHKIDMVRALDDDSSHNGRVSYSIVDNQHTSLFGISPIEGMVWTRNHLDRELRDVYELTVQAVDHGSPPLSATAQVRIIITDENDNSPMFSPKEYRFSIQENKPPRSPVGKVVASDLDSGNNGRIKFSFSGPQSSFLIDADSGEISTQVRLDYEIEPRGGYKLIVLASDMGVSPRYAEAEVSIEVIDRNDNPPTFQPRDFYKFDIAENKPKGTEVVRMVASDPDAGNNGLITYSFDNVTSERTALDKFQIHPRTGLVTTKEVLDYETQTSYRLVVVAEDNGETPLKRSQAITINIDDMNDQTPLFDAKHVKFDCVENLSVGTVVGHVHATDNDSGENGKVSYYLVGGNVFSSFTVNRSTGAIRTVREIDYEESSSHRLSIQAVDNSAALPRSSNISVKIQVIDVNDNSPVFELDPVIIRKVPEGAMPRNDTVHIFMATDRDSGKNGEVRYSIQSYSGQEDGLGPYFDINPVSGKMFVVGDIDYEQVDQITVLVRAEDMCQPGCSLHSLITAVIYVTDINDNAPVFESASSVSVFENENIGYPILVIVAVDGDANVDQSWNNVVRYAIVSGNEDKKFLLADDTGFLTIHDGLDYRAQTEYVLQISAQDSGQPSLITFQTLTINVIDINDHPPQFLQAIYNANVSEGADLQTSIVTIQATDEDIGIDAPLTYLIPEGIGDDKFSIHPVTGVVSLKARLDRERRDSYLVTAYVKDGFHPVHYRSCAISITVTDINDNIPIFKQSSYSVKITENLAQTSLLSLVASDRDEGDNSLLTYSIIDGNDGRFSIDSHLGHLSTQVLDRETTGLYNLTIKAVDHGTPALSAVTSVLVTVLDENDNSPTFLSNVYTGSVPENVSIGTTVMTVTAKDSDLGDNSKVSYSLGNDTLGLFEINSVTGVITTSGVFDREKISNFAFLIVASDHGVSGPRNSTARVDVEITDVNDNPPTFLMVPYTSSVSLVTSKDISILTVHATDPDAGSNGLVEYSLISNGDAASTQSLQYFYIGRTSGTVYSKTSLLTAAGLHSMLVVAADSASPTSARLSSTGVVEIRVGSEKNEDFKFSRREYFKKIPENSDANTDVITVEALYSTSRSSGTTVYSFASGNEHNTFTIDPRLGDVKVLDNKLLDFETNPQTRLIVSASNDNNHAYATLWIDLTDVNDNAPKFSQLRYVSAIWENNQPETYVTQVIARDLDSDRNGEITYTIVGGNDEEVFEITKPHTGIIQTSINAAPLDRDSRPQGYKLIIEARDRGRPMMSSTCILVISIVDENDTPPLFPDIGSKNVSENREVGYQVVMATANDVDLNSVLVYDFTTDGNPQNTFSLDRSSGRLTLAKPLDHEDLSHYSVGIEVSDGKPDHTRTMWMNIYVEDENDNEPVFSQPSYEVALPEQTEPNKAVVTVRATDKDSGRNSEIVYSMAIPPVDSFYIDSNTGTIYTNRTISFTSDQSIIQLVVVAKDKGLPVQSSMVAVHIQITDINKYPPKFLESDGYRAKISELAQKGSSVLTVSAIDEDNKSSRGESLNYTLHGDGKELFYIRQRTGQIIYNGGADYEEKQEYNLIVIATDRGVPQKSASAPVTITILDENDNPPIFVQSHYTITLNEDFEASEKFPQEISATDADSGANAKVKFTITSGNTEGIFFNPNNGGRLTIMNGMKLDYESHPTHHLIMRAIDCYGCPPSSPRLSAFVTVDIIVRDVNEFYPRFPIKHYLEDLVENSTVGTVVFTAHAIDGDGGEAGQLKYTLMEELDYTKFGINNVTGDVYTTVKFDYESPLAHRFYNLTILAEEIAGHADFADVTIRLVDKDEAQPHFVKREYSFDVPGSAKAGHFIGRVLASDDDGGEAGRLIYTFVKPSSLFHIDPFNGNISVAVSLHEYVPEEESSTTERKKRKRRSVDLQEEKLMIEVSSGQPGSKIDRAECLVAIDRGCPGCAAPLRNRSADNSMDGGILAAIVIVCILVIILTILGVMFFLYRRRNPKKSVPNYSSDSTLDLEPPPPHLPSDFIDNIRNTRHQPSNIIASDVSDRSHNSASSGRGSAEVEEEEDEEISRINSQTYMHSSQAFRQKAMPDSGIQHDDDTLSEPPAQTHQEYLANLGIDSSKFGKPKVTQSKESIHQFSDEGGGEGGVDTDFEKITDLETDEEAATLNIRGHGFSFHEPDTRNIGSLSNVINSEEVNSGSYNWDYLIDWGPQYQPLAHVFSEIAKLKDESITPKKQPIKTVPQRQFNSSLKQPKVRTVPPPMITNAPPTALPPSSSERQAMNGIMHGQKVPNTVPSSHPLQGQHMQLHNPHMRQNHPHHLHHPHQHPHHHHHPHLAPGNPNHPPALPSNPPPALPPNHPLGYNFHQQQPHQQQQPHHHHHNHNPHQRQPSLQQQQRHLRHQHSPKQALHRLPPPTHPPPDPPYEEPSQLQSSSGSRSSHQASTTNISLPSLPRSPISYESSLTSAVMTPSLTPSLSPLATRSPSISPVVSSGHNTPGQNLNIRSSNTHSLSSSSEREFTI